MELINLKSLNLTMLKSKDIIKFITQKRGISTKKLLSTIKSNPKRKNNEILATKTHQKAAKIHQKVAKIHQKAAKIHQKKKKTHEEIKKTHEKKHTRKNKKKNTIKKHLKNYLNQQNLKM